MIYKPRYTFDEQIENAQNAIDVYATDSNRLWLQELLDILKQEKYATIHYITGDLCDVQRIAHTYDFASFFDVFNHIINFDTEIMPIVTTELKNKLIRGYEFAEKIEKYRNEVLKLRLTDVWFLNRKEK